MLMSRYLEEQRNGSSSWMLLPDKCKQNFKRLDRRQKRLNTELLKAVEEGDVNRVKGCLDHGASSNATCALHRITASHLAALIGNCEIIHVLWKRGANLWSTDLEGRTPLHLATWNGNVNCLKKILEVAPELIDVKTGHVQKDNHVIREDMDSWNHDHDFTKVKFSAVVKNPCKMLPRLEPGSSSLHVACQKLHVDCVKLLLEAGADKDIRDTIGMTPLDAVGEKVIGEFLQNGDKPFLQIFQTLTMAGAMLSLNTHNFRTTPMHTAMILQQMDAIPVIASTPRFFLGPDHTGASPLHFAVTHRLELPLRVLLQSSITTVDKKFSDITDIDLKDSGGNTPLHLAVVSQWRPGVAIFLEAGADVCEKNSEGATILHLAAEIGNHDILEEILNVPESKCVMNSADLRGETPMFKAVVGCNAACVKLLLDVGARLRQTRTDKLTVMHKAAELGAHEVLEELVRHDNNSRFPMFNLTDSRGMTPLHLACSAGHTHCVRILLSAGCDPNIPASLDAHTNCTPLHLAAARGHYKVVELLLSLNNASKIVNSKDVHGCTPLHVACQNGHRDCIRSLLLSGADLSAKIKKKRITAMELLFRNISQPIAFLESILDSHITINEYSVNDPKCLITVNYRVLVPRDRCNKQMKVMDALFDTGMSCNQEYLVLHPVMESFLFLKWRNWKTWFFCSFIVYLLFLLGFSTVVVNEYYVNEKGMKIPYLPQVYCKFFVIATLSWLVFVELESAWRLPRYYFVELDSWLKWCSYVLSGVVTGIDEHTGTWHRVASSVAIIMVWAELMFQMSRNPNWGHYINMFSKVAMNVCKVLGTFVFLLIGFSLAFMILYNAEVPFESPWAAFVKSSTMMTTDFDYNALFAYNESLTLPIFGQFIFLAFLLGVSIVLMNLMIGIAVSDIADLETRGKMNRLRKQADFLRVIQPSDRKLLCMPRWRLKRKPDILKLQPPIEIRPGNPQCKMVKTLPRHVVDAIVEKAVQQRKSTGNCSVQELYQKLNEVISLSEKSEKLGSGSIVTEVRNEVKILEQVLKEVFSIKNILQGLQISPSRDFRVEVQ